MTDRVLNYLSRLKLTIALFTIIVTVNIIDIYTDLLEGSSLTHVLEETVMILIFISIIIVLIRTLLDSSQKLNTLKVELMNIKQLHAQQTEKMSQARKNYSEVIQHQFNDWKLTKSEKDVGFFLLKGLSLKEIAAIRNVKEKSVRQQASNIYSKAGVAGRHEFAGWFFEDM
ncbi:helix-turn-helix transcriptional regulator [Pleionea sediminis]|uniref:helix-turn-helix transcriptional regulator n=1 Tax=Pleionea sediminis TaxID=2569479 RepID=UPI001FE6CF39|nr:LuxR C-terminal-related transcriptional regulator [Pleionea sediminis]